MSIHPSLRANTLVGERSVLKRIERIQKLLHDDKLAEDDSPYGLPKVRTHFKVKTKPKQESPPSAEGTGEPAEGGEAPEATTGATPESADEPGPS